MARFVILNPRRISLNGHSSDSAWVTLCLKNKIKQKQTKPRRMGEIAQQVKALTAPNLSLILGTPVVEGGSQLLEAVL